MTSSANGWDWTDPRGYATKTCRWASYSTPDGLFEVKAERFANLDAVGGVVDVYDPQVWVNGIEYTPDQASAIGLRLIEVAKAAR